MPWIPARLHFAFPCDIIGDMEKSTQKFAVVKCPQCQRDFADQLHRQYGYVFPVHVINPSIERKQKYVECPGSLKPIAVDDRRAAA